MNSRQEIKLHKITLRFFYYEDGEPYLVTEVESDYGDHYYKIEDFFSNHKGRVEVIDYQIDNLSENK